MNDISGILLLLVLLTTQAKGSRGHKLSQTGSEEAAECRKKTNFDIYIAKARAIAKNNSLLCIVIV